MTVWVWLATPLPSWRGRLGGGQQLGERDEVQGARRAEAEIVGGIQRGCEHRATKQFARADGFAEVSCDHYNC